MEKRKLTELELEIFNHLNEMRETGTVNMFGMRPEIQVAFSLDKNKAGTILALWMENFNIDGYNNETEIEDNK